MYSTVYRKKYLAQQRHQHVLQLYTESWYQEKRLPCHTTRNVP